MSVVELVPIRCRVQAPERRPAAYRGRFRPEETTGCPGCGQLSRQRRVVAKAEHLPNGTDPRFVVTSLGVAAIDGRALYEDVYCARGDVENRIKEAAARAVRRSHFGRHPRGSIDHSSHPPNEIGCKYCEAAFEAGSDHKLCYRPLVVCSLPLVTLLHVAAEIGKTPRPVVKFPGAGHPPPVAEPDVPSARLDDVDLGANL